MPIQNNLATCETFPGLLTPTPGQARFRIEDWLRSHNSGLALVSFMPREDLVIEARAIPGMTHTASMWIGRCATNFGISPQWILMTMQAEQSLALERRVLSPAYSFTPSKTLPVAKHGVRTKDGWAVVEGEWRMAAACGCGIYENRTNLPKDPTHYIGFDSQVFHCAQVTRHYLNDWDKGDHKANLPDGRLVVCENQWAKVLLEWTPHPEVLEIKPALCRSMFL